LNVNWSLGLTQGIIWNEKQKANLLEASLFYRGLYIKNFKKDGANQMLFNQDNPLPDMDSIQQNSFITGLAVNYLVKNNKLKTIKGLYSEISIEWAPSFLNIIADYMRLNWTAKAFIPLFSYQGKNKNTALCLYAGNYFSIDWIKGDTIPINIRQSIGGLYSPRMGSALGGLIRGVDSGRYDANFKLANCTELRLILPVKLITPGFIYYFDAGYYNGLKGTDGGFLLSTGAGIFLDLFNKFQIAYSFGVFLNDTNINGEKVKPFLLSFKFHF
jgi:hypothetical protein